MFFMQQQQQTDPNQLATSQPSLSSQANQAATTTTG